MITIETTTHQKISVFAPADTKEHFALSNIGYLNREEAKKLAEYILANIPIENTIENLKKDSKIYKSQRRNQNHNRP